MLVAVVVTVLSPIQRGPLQWWQQSLTSPERGRLPVVVAVVITVLVTQVTGAFLQLSVTPLVETSQLTLLLTQLTLALTLSDASQLLLTYVMLHGRSAATNTTVQLMIVKSNSCRIK